MTATDEVRAAWLVEDVSARIKHAMQAQGMSPADLARTMGVSPAQVRQWLRGANLQLRTLARIAHALGLRVRIGFVNQRIEAGREPRRRKAGITVIDAPHGTITGYTNYRCRCEACRGAMRAYWRRRRHPDLHEDDIRGTELPAQPKEGS